MLLAQKGYVTGAKGVCYWRKRGMLLAQNFFETQYLQGFRGGTKSQYY
jgi:hypothetical protein